MMTALCSRSHLRISLSRRCQRASYIFTSNHTFTILSMMNHYLRSITFTALFLPTILGAQWAQVNNGLADLSTGAYTLGGSDTHVFVKAGAQIYRSNDHGDTWTAATTPVQGNPTECGAGFNGRYFAGLNASTACIYYSDDNGDSWTEAAGAPTATVVRGFFEYGGALYAYTSNAGIYRTIDGDEWQAVNNGLSNLNVISMSAAGPYFLAATIGGGVFRTINASTWTATSGIGSGDLNAENVWSMGSVLYYSAQGGAEYSSSDFGDTWAAWTQPAFFGLGLLEVKRFDTNLYMETRHFAGGLRDSMYLSTNEGASWTNITANLNAADLNGSGILEHDGYAFIGFNLLAPGQGIYRYGLVTDVDESRNAPVPTVFPNPVDDVLTIRLPGSDPLTYELMDAAGRRVSSGRLVPGTAQVDVARLQPGCYLLRWDEREMAPVRVVKR